MFILCFFKKKDWIIIGGGAYFQDTYRGVMTIIILLFMRSLLFVIIYLRIQNIPIGINNWNEIVGEEDMERNKQVKAR